MSARTSSDERHRLRAHQDHLPARPRGGGVERRGDGRVWSVMRRARAGLSAATPRCRTERSMSRATTMTAP